MDLTARARLLVVLLPTLAALGLGPSALFADPPPSAPSAPWLAGQWQPFRAPLALVPGAPAPDPSLERGTFAERLAAVGRGYLPWGRVDDALRWAAADCRMPPPSLPRLSAAAQGPHARKLYFLYARDRRAYLEGRSGPGQVLVKEAWTWRAVRPGAETRVAGVALTATVDGHVVEPDRAAGLYVMLRARETDPGTDRGWVYGTVGPDGAVTSAGRIASCMGCHEEAGPGRLFGLRRRR
ncbi:MAG: hypothetical protein HY909_03765 [Deltaproteobacteria bacterium]|nr:hypothetical protein [Deltaproteobacteria bacterium]